MLAAWKLGRGTRMRWLWICKALGSQAHPADVFFASMVNGFVRNCNDAAVTVSSESNSVAEATEKASDDTSRAKWIRLREKARKGLVLDILSLGDGDSVESVLENWVKQQTTVSEEQHSQVSAVNTSTLVRTLHGVIQDLAHHGLVEPAWQVFHWMELEGLCTKDPRIYTTMIKIFGDNTSIDWVERLYASLDNVKVNKDTALLNALLCARSRAGRVGAVVQLFFKMEEQSCKRDLVTYNTMMDACVKIGTGLGTVVHLFKQMCEEGIQPDIVSYNILLSACVAGQNVKEAMHVYAILRKRGLTPTVVTYTTLLRVHANAGGCREALKIYAEMVSRGCRPSAVTFNSLISACAREGLVEEAESFFEGMGEFELEPDTVTFNAMMDMYVKQGNYSAAEQVLGMMTGAGLQPNVVTYTTLMSCYKAVGATEKVLNVYDSVKGSRALCNVLTFTEALDACVKGGQISRASEILCEMRAGGHEPTVVTCGVVLAALGEPRRRKEDTKALFESFRCFRSRLVQTCSAMLSDVLDDEEVKNLAKELLGLLEEEEDSKRTIITIFVGLLDALWTFGWRRRGALVLGFTMEMGVVEDICVVSPGEWKLDIRMLSTGGSLVALYQWLSHLSQIAVQFSQAQPRDVANDRQSGVEGQTDATPEPPRDDDEVAGVVGSVHSDAADAAEAAGGISPEILLPLLPAAWRASRRSNGRASKTTSVEGSSGAMPVGSPRIVTVVTGWGKLSKQQGASQVKVVVDRELKSLRAPFQASTDSGRWVARFEALMYWLLRQTLARMALSDVPRNRTS